MSVPNHRSLTLAIVGDIHEQWDAADASALSRLGVDLVLFVGDFGNESLATVRQIAELAFPKASIFGNHDAWYTATPWGRRKCPYNPAEDDRFQQQLDLLQDCRVGYGRKDFAALGLGVVGSRPFSWGGPEWKNKTFYRERFGVTSFDESSAKITQAALASPHQTLLMIGHNGPTGLGDRPEEPCGKDWNPISGDYGDPDFEQAIAQIKAQGKSVPLVGFGHMHHTLRHRKDRLRTCALYKDDTLYLNAARCPRIVDRQGQRLRNFSRVTLRQGQVERAELVWVDGLGAIAEVEAIYGKGFSG
jgi:uncharacterized protein (TIGR04168 family)